jgi:hypothetical protein
MKRKLVMSCDTPWGPAVRIYTRRLMISMLIYLVLLFIAVGAFNRPNPPTGTVAVLLAMLPAFPIIGAFWAIARLMIEMNDEYQRMLMVKQILIATGLTLSIVTVWGFLENFDQVQHISAFYVSVLWFVMFGVAGALARLRA